MLPWVFFVFVNLNFKTSQNHFFLFLFYRMTVTHLESKWWIASEGSFASKEFNSKSKKTFIFSAQFRYLNIESDFLFFVIKDSNEKGCQCRKCEEIKRRKNHHCKIKWCYILKYLKDKVELILVLKHAYIIFLLCSWSTGKLTIHSN
jgi:hypothetical protein